MLSLALIANKTISHDPAGYVGLGAKSYANRQHHTTCQVETEMLAYLLSVDTRFQRHSPFMHLRAAHNS